MTLLLSLIVLSCVIGIVAGFRLPGARWAGVISACILLYVGGWIAWWFALYLHVVSLDGILAPFDYAMRNRLDGFVYLVPPLLLPVAFLTYSSASYSLEASHDGFVVGPTRVAPIYARLRGDHTFGLLSPAHQFATLASEVEKESPSKAASMREWTPAAQLAMLAWLRDVIEEDPNRTNAIEQ